MEACRRWGKGEHVPGTRSDFVSKMVSKMGVGALRTDLRYLFSSVFWVQNSGITLKHSGSK